MSNVSGTQAALGLLWLRILMGAGIAYHGYGKIFGGYLEKFAEGIAEMGFPLPMVFAWAAALSEFLGGLCVALGFQTRIAAAFVFATMTVAAFIRHAADPLNVKELALAYWTIAGALILTGG
ncbi:MAG: DoxX family protein, partial [Candidatus Omnitrophica bacterium]|nr:DoxX family protein [Candidatus Omnitrophota bacterium]